MSAPPAIPAPGAPPFDTAKLRAFVLARGLAPGDADDAVQETVARVLDAMARGVVREPTAYAYRVAQNLLTRQASERKRWNALPDDLESPAPSVDHAIDARATLAVVERALRTMPKRRREIFLRARLDGVSHRQIAQERSMSVAAVQKHVSRAALAIVSALEARAEEEGTP